MSHVDPRPTRPGAWVAALSIQLLFAVPAFAQQYEGPPVQVIPASPCTFDDVRMIFKICTCNSRILSAARVSAVDARLDVATNPTIVCVQCAPDTIGVDFGRLSAGHHRLGGMIVHHIVAGPDSGQIHTENYAVEFDVRSDCGPDPVPLPWLTGVQVGPPLPCPGDSIQVQLRGVFNDPCYSVAELIAYPSPIAMPGAAPFPVPDVVRIIYEHDPCTACPAVLTPWRGQLPISPLPAGEYRLPVEAFLRERCPGGTADSLIFLGRTSFPFKVAPCESTGACYLASFVRGPAPCALVGPDRPGEAVFQLFTQNEAAGGVQGKLVFSRPGLRVIAIEPLVQGMVLKWDPTETGASFVAVLPAEPPPALGQVLFRVRVALVEGATFTGYIRLSPEELLVSDTHGVAMPMCDISRFRLADPAALFCPEAGCDMNEDGRADVRDLVLMVNCLQHPYDRCAGATTPDCDENGQRNIDDVLCCARVILGGSRPDSTGSVPAPEVSVQFGAPVVVNGGVDVPVLLTARGRIGAARLEFAYPAAGYTGASIVLAEGSANWLALSQDEGGTLRLGVLRIAPEIELADQVDAPLLFTLRLTPREGAAPAGVLSFVSGDFSSTEGATLVTSAGPLSMPLAPGASLAVGLARPNPFGRETRFSVSLPHDANLDVSIYDLAGRKVATLWSGPAIAGTKDLVWRRTRDDGTIVPSGMYFYRATSEGHSQGGKVLVLTRD